VTDQLVRAESPAEFFKEHVEAACVRQRLHVSPPAAFYVVNLLTVFAHAETGDAMKDHTEHVVWLGPSEMLNLAALSRA